MLYNSCCRATSNLSLYIYYICTYMYLPISYYCCIYESEKQNCVSKYRQKFFEAFVYTCIFTLAVDLFFPIFKSYKFSWSIISQMQTSKNFFKKSFNGFQQIFRATFYILLKTSFQLQSNVYHLHPFSLLHYRPVEMITDFFFCETFYHFSIYIFLRQNATPSSLHPCLLKMSPLRRQTFLQSNVINQPNDLTYSNLHRRPCLLTNPYLFSLLRLY